MEEEIYGDDILSKAIEYSESTQFEEEIDRFRRKYRTVFNDHSSKQKDGMVEEQVSQWDYINFRRLIDRKYYLENFLNYELIIH